MKKNILLLILTLLAGSFSSFSQTYNMSNGTINGCTGTFLDPGGAGNYANGIATITQTFCSDNGGEIALNFTGFPFQVETNWDFLTIYDGPIVAGPALYNSQTSGGTTNPGVITSTTGCLTVTFSSDGSVNYTGWQALIQCPSCTNGILDGNETSIDCGGPTCPPCPNCYDGIQNNGETGIDCGGTCDPCHCGNGILDGDETDVDCGGSCGDCPTPCSVVLTYTETPPGIDCNGGDVTLTAVGQGEYVYVLNNDFDAGGAGIGWNSNITADFTNPCDPSIDGGTYMWMGNSAAHPRIIETLPLDLSCGGEICFFLDFATQGNASPCEGIDEADEGVYLEYSTDNGVTWTTMEYYGPAGVGNTTNGGGTNAQMTAWNEYCLPIPPGASTPSTLFHWAQTGSSGNGNDHWGIDNVTITSLQNCLPYVYDYSQVPGTDDNPVQGETVTTTTTYTVTYTNGVDACSTSIDVIVPPGTNADAGADQTLCFGAAGVTIGADPVCNDEGATYSWDNGAGAGTIDLVGGGQDHGQVVVNPAVTTTYTLTTTFNGCVETDQVTVTVDAPPTASNPAPINVQCAADVPGFDITVVTDEADDITIPPTVTYIGEASDGNTCPEVITRTYRVTDACGNFVDVTQTITIDDTQNPVFAAEPADITVQCVGDVPADFDLAWTDNCDIAGVVTSVDGPIVGGNCGGTITRTWNYSDACGNPASATQIITINDTQNPVFAAEPADITVQCVGDVPADFDLAWTDNCDGAGVVTSVDGPIVGGNCGGTITRTWNYSDACGNPASATQIITINDTQNPVFAAEPADITVQCVGDVPADFDLAWTDNCDGAGVVTSVDGPIVGGNCGGTITRTWNYSDACGNPASATQIITINDTQNPVFAAEPADVTVQCVGDVPADFDLAWTDNCDGAGVVTSVDGPIVGGNCGGTITRTWNYSDACGNPATATQIITIDDTQNPVFAAEPADVTVQCVGDVPADFDLAWTDNCDGAGVVTSTDGPIVGGNCGGTITRTWNYSDACGNPATATQIITINDTQNPVFAAEPADITVQCVGDVPADFDLAWTDNCDIAGVVTSVDGPIVGGNCGGTITRTWNYSDACGNPATATQIITINDTQNPVFAAPPADLAVECIGDVPAAGNLGWTDNCDGFGDVLGIDLSDGNTCPEVITRTWTYTDACGNPATVTQTITVHDITNPSATNPAGTSITNLDPVPPVDITVVIDEADNCTVNPVVAFVSESTDGGACPEIITRIYSVTDDCNNTINVTHTITIGDAAPPTATDPIAVNVECAADVPLVDETVVIDEADDSGVPTVIWEDDNTDGLSCPETILRRYRVTDACGNFIFATQTITIEDITPPVFAAPPADVTVECVGDVPADFDLAWTDNCDIAGVVTSVDGPIVGGNCGGTITRTWSYTDACGNPATETQIITIDDTQNPVFDPQPADIAVQCASDVPVAGNLSWNDNCDGTGSVLGTDLSDGNTCPEVITRTWTYTDACGNPATVTQTITVHDTQNPVFDPEPADIAVQCPSDVPVAGNLDWNDNCDGTGSVLGTDVSDGNTCPEVITRTWTYTDICGNPATVTQLITVHDTQNPVFDPEPADVTVECIGDVPPAINLDWTDNCDGTGSVLGIDVSDGNTCPEVITRTWTYTDVCGNPATVTQTITVHDITNPTATNPAGTSITNLDPVPPVDITVVIDEADNCTVNPVVAFVSESTDGGACPEIITRIYSVTDDCNNTINVTHTITIGDAAAPTATDPIAVNVECAADVPLIDETVVIDEADDSGVPTVAWEDDTSNGLTCPETILRRYRVTDNCGNFIFVTQTITIEDITAPVFAAPPADVTVECVGDVPADFDLAWTDNCDGAGVVTSTDGPIVGGNCGGTITRTWTYSDVCGNPATVTQTITINDTQNPVFAAPPADVTVECVGDVPADFDLGWTDNCDGAGVVTSTDGPIIGGNCGGTITRTWTYSDACGNPATVTQTITINDTQNPVFAAPPADLTVECIGDVPAAGNLGWTDNCDGFGDVLGTDASDGNTCPEVITRTWTYTDACGNPATVTQTITVNDITNPTASNPATTTVPGGPAPAIDITVVTDEADNCTANPVVAFVSESSDNAACPETITRIYSVTDDCNNTINVTHTILITDPFPPTATDPITVNVECAADVPLVDETVVIDEADNNGVPTVAWEDDTSNGLSCPETILRRYRVTDACGNFIFATQTIIIEDVTAPVFAAPPADVTVECVGDVPADFDLAWTDNCDIAGVVTSTDGPIVGGNCGGTITRTWTYSDACGNPATVTQTITINDTQNPVFDPEPADVSVQCIGDVPVAINLDWNDNCDGTGSVLGTDVSDGNTCPEIITRTWTYTDACGNPATVTQTITVLDTQNPVFDPEPADVSVQCIGDVPVPGNLDWNDNCDGTGSVLGTDVSDGNTCPEIITRTWTYTDACGNPATVTQTITVLDTQNPVFDAPPVALNVECIGDVPVAGNLNWNDNCDGTGSVLGTDVSDGNTCPEIITRTWTYTDACGNPATVTQTITVNDITNPTASNPATTTVPGGPAPAVDIAVVIDEADNCTVNPVVAFVSESTDGGNCPETITRIYSITDDCGNSINVTHTILITDPIFPTATNPITVNVECIGDVPPFDITVVTDEADNQSVPVVAFVSDVSNGLSCPETITRTYSVTDICGNQILVTQDIIVNDVTNPTASNPAAINVQCIGDVPATDVSVVTDEADNCTAAPLVTFVSQASDGLSCPETITRTYRITDDCGNFIEVTQDIIVNDVTNPTASNPVNISVPGANDVPAPNILDVIDEADNCTANPTVVWVSDVSDGNICNNEKITRTYSITDDCGNTINVTQEITILATPAPINAGPDVTICIGDDVTVTADNPWGAIISWTPPVTDGVSFTPGATATYTVTADNLGCISSDDVTVTVEDLPSPSFVGDILSGCMPTTTMFTSTTPGNIVSSVWTIEGVDVTDAPNANYSWNSPGLYDVTLTTTSATGCVNTVTYSDYIYIESDPLASFSASSNEIDNIDSEVQFNNTSQGAVDYQWSFGDNTAYNNEVSPSHTFPDEEANTFVVELIAYSPLGCTDTAYTTIKLTEELIFYIPNTFTPDNDDYNETFQPVFTSGFDPYNFTMYIFNRWGEIVFESNNASEGWDGRYGGEIVKDGTFVWKIEFKTSATDERKLATGHVNILR